MKKSIYKNPEAKTTLMALYDAKLKACNIPFEDLYVDTFAGKTHLLACGDPSNPPFFILHGINAGAPLALEAVKDLRHKFRIYAVDTLKNTKHIPNASIFPEIATQLEKWLMEL